MNEEQVGAFNLAVELYTDLLFNQKELVTKIIEVSYSRGIQEGIVYAQKVAEQEYLAQVHEAEQRAEQQPEEYVPKTIKVPENPFDDHKVQPPVQSDVRKLSEQEQASVRPRSPAEELISKMKGVRR